MRVRVLLQNGGKLDPELIVDPMATTKELAAERGRNHLADQGYSKVLSRYTLPPMALPLPGDLLRAEERTRGRAHSGRVTGWSLSVEASESGEPSASAEIEMERLP